MEEALRVLMSFISDNDKLYFSVSQADLDILTNINYEDNYCSISVVDTISNLMLDSYDEEKWNLTDLDDVSWTKQLVLLEFRGHSAIIIAHSPRLMYYIDFFQESERDNPYRIERVDIEKVKNYITMFDEFDFKAFASFNHFKGKGSSELDEKDEGKKVDISILTYPYSEIPNLYKAVFRTIFPVGLYRPALLPQIDDEEEIDEWHVLALVNKRRSDLVNKAQEWLENYL